MADVSVIIPVYNVEEYLKKCVDSVTRQTHTDIEIILVDDGSRDRSGEICDALAAADARIKVIHKENAGVGYARNSGLDVAVGKYICFADPDDYVESDLIADNLKIAEETGADITVFGYVTDWRNSSGEITAKQETLPALNGFYTYEEFKKHFDKFYPICYTAWNRLYKRELLERGKHRFGKQRIGEDAMFNIGIYAEPLTIAFNQKAYYHYIRRAASASMRYQPARIEEEMQVAAALKRLVVSFGFDDGRFDRIITKAYFLAINLAFRNYSLDSCPLGFKEKRKQLQALLADGDVKEAVEKARLSDFARKTEKIKVWFIKHNMLAAALLFGRLKIKMDNIGA